MILLGAAMVLRDCTAVAVVDRYEDMLEEMDAIMNWGGGYEV